MRVAAMVLALGILLSQPCNAQSRAPTDGGFSQSLGQPPAWKLSAGAALGRSKGEVLELLSATEGRLSAYHDLLNPVVGVAALNIEGYAGTRGKGPDGGVRAQLISPILLTGLGIDYNIRTNAARVDISYSLPMRRGGLFHDGSVLRADVMPGRHWYVMLGIDRPIRRHIPVGRTRPPSDRIALPVARTVIAPNPSVGTVRVLDVPMAEARLAAQHIRRLTVPFLDHLAAGNERDAATVQTRVRALQQELTMPTSAGIAPYRTLNDEVLRYHSAIARAFSSALTGASPEILMPTTEGTKIAKRARDVLLQEVLLPYDRMLGQTKRHDTTREFANRARGIFMRWLHVESSVPAPAYESVLWVFTALLDLVEQNRAALRAEWSDSRFVWLPLQYALTPDQHDSQSELDALIEQAVSDRFEEGNFVSYVINEQFQLELSRTIRQAARYHVLWVHDFRGYNTQGEPDKMSFHQVLWSYLPALTAQVRDYDRTGRFPVYLIMLDQFFYQINGSRLWMDLLEDPTRHRVRLPKGFKAYEDSLAVAQDSLRAAIAQSKLLQSHRGQFGDQWLRDLIRVHVNITNVADQSFFSWRLIPGLATTDNMMRDHRKIAFYDITEADPYTGEAIYTGAGVGEHYSSLAWEDRALLIRGPALLALKTAARDALISQGIRPANIPFPLQRVDKPADYARRIRTAEEQGQRPLRALGLHNQTGFDEKEINVAKAILYTLMPPGSVIKIPDSLWNSPFWGSAVVGCALRGVRVLVIAPSLANAPANSFGSMIRAHDLLSRLIVAAKALEPNIAHAGGLLKVGLFSSDLEVTNLQGKLKAIQATFEHHQWLRELFGTAPGVYSNVPPGILAAMQTLAMKPTDGLEFKSDRIPKLHLKANYFASREGWRVMARPEWADLTWAFWRQRISQTDTRAVSVGRFDGVPERFPDIGIEMERNWLAGLVPIDREHVVFYTIMGSQNQNARSMVTDGEDAFIVSNWLPVIPYMDLIDLVGQSRWVESTDELDVLLPTQSTARRWLAHWAKMVF